MASTVKPSPRIRRWTRLEYDRLIDLGVFQPGERLELLDDFGRGADHQAALAQLLRRGAATRAPFNSTSDLFLGTPKHAASHERAANITGLAPLGSQQAVQAGGEASKLLCG